MWGSRGKGVLAAALIATLAGAGAGAQTALPPDESRTLGEPVADAVFVAADGSPFAIRSLAGKPVVVSPIFTRCQHTCPTITSNLKRTVAQVGVAGEDFEVLSVSFDVADTPDDLARFHQRMHLPEAWKLVRADAEALLPFLDSLDFRFISDPNGGFTHPNLVVVLSPELIVTKYLYGKVFEAEDLRAALALARGEDTLLQAISPYLFVVGVLGALVAAFVVALLIGRARGKASKPS
jgi:protein SCO1/2